MGLTTGPLALAVLTLGLPSSQMQLSKDLYARSHQSIETKKGGKTTFSEQGTGLSQSARKQQAALIPVTGQQEYNRRTIQMVKD